MNQPRHFPADSPEGPWGVDEVGGFWCVIHRITGRTKREGPVIGISSRKRPNYFDRAMQRAAIRNRLAAVKALAKASEKNL